MCHNLPRIGYKMPYNKVYTKENTMLEEFVNYVDSFYGQNDPLYPLYYEGQPLTKEDIRHASIVYLDRCQSDDFENCLWGDGDSLDRERVRDILTDKFNYSYSVLTSFNKGNWA